MPGYHGDFRLEDTLDIKFCTVTTTGAPTVLAGSPVVSAYPGNSTTQLTAGITLSVDFDSVVGLNNVRVVATAANGYAAATNYQLVITTGTVGGTSVVGYCVGSFSIENRSALMPTIVARKLDVSAGGEAGVDWANVGSPTTALNLSGTNIDVDQIVASVSGAVGSVTGLTVATISDGVWDEDATGHQTGGTFGQAIGDPVADTNTIYKAVVTDATGVTVGADIVAMKVDTAAILVDTGTTLDAALAVVDANVDAILVDTGTTLDGKIDAIDTVVDAILVDTATTLQGELDVIQADVAAILVDTSTTLQGELDGLQATIGVAGAGLTIAAVTGAVGSIAAGGIATASFAAGAIDAAALATDAGQEIADRLITRRISGGADTGRTVKEALAVLRNKAGIAGGTLTVTDVDDTTTLWTAAVTTAAGDPISDIDPA